VRQIHVRPSNSKDAAEDRSGLEQELDGNLRDTRRGSFHDLPECRIVDVPIHWPVPVELGVIERVERFDAQFQRFALRQFGDLVECHVVRWEFLLRYRREDIEFSTMDQPNWHLSRATSVPMSGTC
jgi:hypothetical protein